MSTPTSGFSGEGHSKEAVRLTPNLAGISGSNSETIIIDGHSWVVVPVPQL
jgi:hypothetical protein